jgi:hypothetical protein
VVDAAAAAPSDEQAGSLFVGAAQSRSARMSDLVHWTLARGQVGSRRLHEGLALAGTGPRRCPGVTPRSITQRPRWVRERIETAYLEAKASGLRADVAATPRDPWSNGRLLRTPPATG